VDGESDATTTPQGESYPARSRYQGSVAADYLAGRVHDPRWDREQDAIAGFLRQRTPGSTIVDIPFGTGRFVEFYAECDHVIYGLDVSRDMVVQARTTAEEQRAKFGPVLAEIEAIPLRDRSVDHVVCVRFLNWVSLPVVARILAEFDRVARKEVLIHVRVRKALGPAELARAFSREAVSEPVPLLRRFAGAVRQRLVETVRALATGRSTASESYGYVLHDATSLDEVIRGAGFDIVERLVIESTTTYSRSQIEPLYVFVLNRTERDA